MVEDLLATKLHIPPARTEYVHRPRITAILDGGTRRKLTLLSAPAGFGKTTQVSMWARQASTPVAWLSLDAEDNDLARFLAYLIAALQQVFPELGNEAQGILNNPQLPANEIVLTSLLNDLTGLNKPIVLVLDDYHLIQDQKIHQAMIFLIDHLPEGVHLVIATRADPPLPLPRLRVRGQLIELRQRDLRFTTVEAATFLNDLMGLNLSVEDIAALETRTEGWIAGLQMAALSLQGRTGDPASRAAFIRAFTGSHRFVLDYLVEEVLEGQPPEIQTFLLKTSILRRLCGSLCDYILGEGDTDSQEIGEIIPSTPLQFSIAQGILEQLQDANIFIVPLDDERQWYRYHRLFSDLLRKRLLGNSPDLVPELHRRASTWHENEGLMNAAIDHALAAGNFERSASLIEDNAEAFLMRSEVRTFLNWMERLPEEVIQSRQNLCCYQAWALLMSGHPMEDVEQRLEDIITFEDSAEDPGVISGRIAVLRAHYMLFQADLEASAKLCQQALEQLHEEDSFFRGNVTWILGLARLIDGDSLDSIGDLKEVARIGQESGNPLITVTALCYQAKLQTRLGRPHRAREILEGALTLATDSQGKPLPIASEVLMALGELKREWNELETAAEYLTESIRLAKQWNELASFEAYFPLARVRLAQGDIEAAREAIETGRMLAVQSKITDLDDLMADLQGAHFSILLGDTTNALRWAEKQGLMDDDAPKPYQVNSEDQDAITAHLRKYQYIILVRLLILLKRGGDAFYLLNPLIDHVQKLGRVGLLIELHILRALAYQASGQTSDSLMALSEALQLAEPGGYLRIFLDEGEPMVRLLRQATSQGISPTYVSRLLAAYEGTIPSKIKEKSELPHHQPIAEPLSERELEVLRLLATGMSNPEIADKLVVAVSTVRSHCKNIYSKLNVHKRWDAVQQAQELGLI